MTVAKMKNRMSSNKHGHTKGQGKNSAGSSEEFDLGATGPVNFSNPKAPLI